MKLVECINSAVKWRNKITISLQTYISDMHPFLAHTIGFFLCHLSLKFILVLPHDLDCSL